MMTMFNPEYVKMTAERTERIKGDIAAFRSMDIFESKIKENIIRRYDLTPAYAQNFLYDDWAL